MAIASKPGTCCRGRRRVPCRALLNTLDMAVDGGIRMEWLAFPSAGFAYLVMDTRGQGSVGRRGDTPDLPNGANPSVPGFMTQGVLDPQTYYYRRLYIDAVRAVEAIGSRPEVDNANDSPSPGAAKVAAYPSPSPVCCPRWQSV